jgi:hypothetical protein
MRLLTHFAKTVEKFRFRLASPTNPNGISCPRPKAPKNPETGLDRPRSPLLMRKELRSLHNQRSKLTSVRCRELIQPVSLEGIAELLETGFYRAFHGSFLTKLTMHQTFCESEDPLYDLGNLSTLLP